MGYFSNGDAGEAYEAAYCARCIHGPKRTDKLCAVWALHFMHNYDECNKPESFLHVLIPRSGDRLGNEECAMFIELPDLPDERQAALF